MKTNFKKKLNSYQLLFLAVLLVLMIGITFYHYVEGLRWIDAYYYSVITLTTVGYGDITPKTDVGKIFTTIYLLVGIGLMGLFINSVVARAQERRKKREELQENKE